MNATTDSGNGQNRTGGGSNRSAAELEREGNEIRADLDRTLDEIESRFSPGEVLDRSVEFLRSHGSDFLDEAGETVRRHPVPVLLSAAGLIWLTSSILKSRSSASRDETPVEDSSLHRGSGYGQAAAPTTGKAAGKLSSSMQAVKARSKGAMHAAQERTQAAGSRVGDFVQEQPVALGAIALAAGALIGAAFPITAYENRLAGPVHDRTMARAKELGQREYENLRETVTSSLKGTNGSDPWEKAADQPPLGEPGHVRAGGELCDRRAR